MNVPIGTTLQAAARRLSEVGDAPRLEAEVLLAHAADRPRAWLLARGGEALSEDTHARFQDLLERRLQGYPVAYLMGSREFWSRRFRVTPDVLIPRPETEHLVEAVLELAGPNDARRIADLGTGSGAVAVTLGLELPRCRVVATDVSPAALALARENALQLGAANVEFRLADWFTGLEGERFGIVASNPPYVATGDPHLDTGDLRFEPRLALAAEEDGLAAIRTIADRARAHLEPGGWLALEHGYAQGEAVAGLLRSYGYAAVSCREDIAGQARITRGRFGP